MDQGSTTKRSAVHNFAPRVKKFCVMCEGLSLPHDTKFGNCRGEIVDRRTIFIWSLIHGSGWSVLIKAEPGASEAAQKTWMKNACEFSVTAQNAGLSATFIYNEWQDASN